MKSHRARGVRGDEGIADAAQGDIQQGALGFEADLELFPVPGVAQDLDQQSADPGQSQQAIEDPGQGGDAVAAPVSPLPLGQEEAFLGPERVEPVPDAVHGSQCQVGHHIPARRRRIRSIEGDRFRQLPEPGRDEALQLVDPRDLPGIVLDEGLQPSSVPAQPAQGNPVGIQVDRVVGHQVAALARLGLHQGGQGRLGRLKHLVGVGHPVGIILQHPDGPGQHHAGGHQDGQPEPEEQEQVCLEPVHGTPP